MRRKGLQACANCGLYGWTEIISPYTCGTWGIFCGGCKKGYVSKFLWCAIWKWNHVRRKQLKQMAKDKARMEDAAEMGL